MFLLSNSVQFDELSVIMMKLWAPLINDIREKKQVFLDKKLSRFVISFYFKHIIIISNLFHLDSLYEGELVFENEKVLL